MTRVEHARRTLTVRPAVGEDAQLGYDVIVITAGAVTRKFPVPGIAEQAIGMKHVEEAVAIRDTLLTAFDRASVLPPEPERQRLLTVTVVGGGFSGVEGFGELLSLATALLRARRRRPVGRRRRVSVAARLVVGGVPAGGGAPGAAGAGGGPIVRVRITRAQVLGDVALYDGRLEDSAALGLRIVELARSLYDPHYVMTGSPTRSCARSPGSAHRGPGC